MCGIGIGGRIAVVAILITATLWGSGSATASTTGLITDFPLASGTNPTSITVGPDSNLWFVEFTTNKIGRMSPTGTLLNEYPSGATGLSEITTGPDGNLWFTENAAIGRMTPQGEVTHFSAGVTAPMGITAGPDGNVWFTDYGASKIGRITPTGVIDEFGGLTSAAHPNSITTGPDGNLWFTEFSTSKIGRMSTSGATPTEFSLGITGTGLRGISAGADGNLWFAEFSSDKVARITLTGAVTEYQTSSGPQDVSPGPDGNLWAAIRGGNRISRITPAGTLSSFTAGIPPSAGLNGLTAGPDGNMWFTEFGTSRIGRISTGAPAPSLRVPSVAGSLEAGTGQQCVGDQWATWAGEQPSPTRVQWSLNGQQIAGATGWSFTPATSDIGKSVTCAITVTYPLDSIKATAVSDPATVVAQQVGPQGSTGPTGATGAPGAQGPQGDPGVVKLITCTTKKIKGKTKKKCTTKTVTGTVTFTTRGKGTVRATMSRARTAYAVRLAARGGSTVIRSPRAIPRGAYRLVVAGRVSHVRVD